MHTKAAGWKEWCYKDKSRIPKEFSRPLQFSYSSLGGDQKVNVDIFVKSVPSASPHSLLQRFTNKLLKWISIHNGPDSSGLNNNFPTRGGGKTIMPSFILRADMTCSVSSGITMVSFFSSMVMCVALGIPSPSKNPSLVNSSWAAGEQLDSLSAFASGTKKENNEDTPLRNFSITSGGLGITAACLVLLCIFIKCTKFDSAACPLAIHSN